MQNSLTGPRNENDAVEISNIYLTSVTNTCPIAVHIITLHTSMHQ